MPYFVILDKIFRLTLRTLSLQNSFSILRKMGCGAGIMIVVNKRAWIGLIGVILVFAISACTTSNREITINLKETNINQVIQEAAAIQDLPFQVQSVDMQDGMMRVFMSYRKPSGSELTGVYDISLKADQGQLKAEILKVEMDGLVLDQPILDKIAELITKDFINASSNIRGQVSFQSLQIHEDGLQMVLQITQ